MNKYAALYKIGILFVLSFLPDGLYAQGDSPETLHTLANKFPAPDAAYHPHVWWHWLGSNFSKEGITKDLEAMKESGIGGATIFNIASSVQESHFPMENNPWPEQTFRSEAYWDAMKHTMKEAKRLGLKIGLHGTPGYSTTGGPWITEEKAMKALISSKTIAEGGNLDITLPVPELPEFTGYDSKYTENYKPQKASEYQDITVIAVPDKPDVSVDEAIEISRYMDAEGSLKWQAPEGKWLIYRYGYAPTMGHPHPLPDDIIGKSLEVDKMSRENNIYHWQQLLEPLKEHIGEYFGDTFTYIWVDSYEAGYQNWTPGFREAFVRIKGYDPMPWIALYQYKNKKELEHRFTAWHSPKFKSDKPGFDVFIKDYDDVVNRLYTDNGWYVAKEMLHENNLKFYWEPYGGPFSNYEGSMIADIPVGEFWSSEEIVHKNYHTLRAAVEFNKRIVAAEALTGSPVFSKYTEDPAFMKHTVDGGYACGYNLYFLHHWVHQPFDDRYQPGMGMGWWGTHFSRFQTWYKPAKAFFTYLSRCQMLLQQGDYVLSDDDFAHRRTPEADIFFVINPEDDVRKTYSFPITGREPELWDAYHGTIRQTSQWKQQGDSTFVELNLGKDESMFVVFPYDRGDYPVLPEIRTLSQTSIPVGGPWHISFHPKIGAPFKRTFSSLADWSMQKDEALNYFSGTAKYEKTIRIKATELGANKRIRLDLGELHDIAELEVNGKNVGVLWAPPYQADITPYLKAGDNKLTIYITNNWANRLIGDEQYPADFEWGQDRSEEGRAMKAFPDWFLQNKQRPSKGRKTFNVWYYYKKDSPLYPAGLLGPVQLINETVQYPDTLQSLAEQFAAPPDVYKPRAWWHWLGSNFSKEGITKDLHAMKESGVGGVIVFNAPSWLNTERNPWPQQTYRSTAYWEALNHTLSEAKKLDMVVGIHNSPGWSTTGGPWITPEQGMQAATFSVTKINGARKVTIQLPNPKENEETAAWFKDVAVMAVPAHRNAGPDDILDVSGYFANGTLNWEAPPGEWTIYRFGYYPTMQRSHPTPEDVEKTSFEVDKMNVELTRFHWNNVLNPLTERFKEFIGSTFTIIWTDSYESWGQSWSKEFRADFIRMKAYDPVRQIVLALERGEEIFDKTSFHLRDTSELKYGETKRFVTDYAEVINRLYLDCFRMGKEMVNQAGFQYYWEPYGSIIDAPFDMEEGESIADVPTTEFWVHSVEPSGEGRFAEAAAKYGKRLVAAEAFTGMEATCTFNETPAMLKRPADMAFNYGVNQLFLHSWAHNPLDDKYQPGWNFAHYGTHFSRNQTWSKPSKAFFTYLARCQMLLQQGTFIERDETILHRSMPEAELFFVRNTGKRFDNRIVTFNVKNRKPQLWNAYTGKISAAETTENGGVALSLEQNESVFVVFPANETHDAIIEAENVSLLQTIEQKITGKWHVTFSPKTGEKPFVKTFDALMDLSRQNNFNVKYFSGTAVYEKTLEIQKNKASKILLDLGTVYDMAEVEINGISAGVLWMAPFKTDITDYVKAGNNTLKIKVTNTWQNRLIGDEQYPADFEWITKENNGEPSQNGLPRMNGLPEWVRNNTPRPSKERKTFIPWSYFSKDSPLAPSGLVGPVTINYQEISTDYPSDTLSVCDLRCEYIKDPLGIANPYKDDEPDDSRCFSPRVSWKIAGESEAKRQAAYRIMLTDKPEKGEIVWDSGTVNDSRQYAFVPGSLLRPGGDYYWKVGVYYNGMNTCVWSEPARFSMGLRQKDWQGQWINHPGAPKESHLCYRKEFIWSDNSEIPTDFFAYIASSGYHELYINGEKAGNNVLAPTISRIDKRILYVTYDISRLVKKGRNTIAVHYGPGWSINNYFARQHVRQGILVQLYGGKDSFSLSSDTTWLCQEGYSKNSGRFDFMDMGGELIDGRKYTGQWMKPGFDDSRWSHASECKMENRPHLSAQMSEPSQITDTVFAVNRSEITDPLASIPTGKMIYRVDMGRQFTGFLEATFEGLNPGDTVEIMVSMRDANPEFVQASYGVGNDVIEEQKQKQLYIARGEDGEVFRNRFNYFAGRYIHFRGLKKAPALHDVKGLVVSSAPEMTAAFECSDSLYNKLFALDAYTYRMCHTEGVVADCPNRERLGYGPEGAYQTMWGLGLPCFNSSAYYIKNVRDWGDVQQENGFINNVAPQISDMYGCVLNGTALLNTAWEHYRIYGDKRILEAAWPVGEKWLGFLDNHVKDSMLTRYDTHGYFLGDWVSPGPVFEYAETEEALFFNNCSYAMTLDFIVRIARELDIPDAETNRYAEKLNALRKALHKTYYRPETGSYQNGDQVRTAFALYAGIVPDALEEDVMNYLDELLRRQQYINVGSFGRYPFYKTILGEPRYTGVMDGILAKRTYPGYGYFIDKGCTTLPEMWEIDQPNSTVIHTSYTGISAFFIKTLAGINEACAGSDTLRITPVPVERLSWCKAATETPYGSVESTWERNGEDIKYTFAIPFGMVARIKLAGEEEKTVPSGHYTFQVKSK